MTEKYKDGKFGFVQDRLRGQPINLKNTSTWIKHDSIKDELKYKKFQKKLAHHLIPNDIPQDKQENFLDETEFRRHSKKYKVKRSLI